MENKFEMFRNRLAKVYKHLSKTAKRLQVSCYRLYDHDLPEFPFCIEIYQDKLYVAEYKRRHGLDGQEYVVWLEKSKEVMSEITGVSPENIFMRMRQRKSGRQGQYQKQSGDQSSESGVQSSELVVEENGLKFLVNMTDYLDTGLFLDHRITRQMIKDESNGKKVLNLFAYTGSFSVYAAAGKAREVVTVDLSNTYLNWAERNMQLNGFTDKTKYSFIQADVISWLKTNSKAQFDMIILDPPTFSNSQRMEGILDVQRDHVQLINDCLALLKKGGKIWFSTNARTFRLEEEKINTTLIKDITKATTAFDFEGRFSRFCYLIEKV
jgi:23S rRNA (cytosine1962-C5)-methyltransferase